MRSQDDVGMGGMPLERSDEGARAGVSGVCGWKASSLSTWVHQLAAGQRIA